MTESVQQVWDRFERWCRRYRKSTHSAIHEMTEAGYCEDSWLYLAKWPEFAADPVLDLGISEADLRQRIEERISFIRGYLVDISFDGSEFMSKQSRFLTLQYPGKCDRALGIWLEQYLDGKCEAGGYFGFQEFDVSLFVRDLADVDVGSMRTILPFDAMHLRKPSDALWTNAEIQIIKRQIKNDIEGDGYDATIRAGPARNFLSLSFTWK